MSRSARLDVVVAALEQGRVDGPHGVHLRRHLARARAGQSTHERDDVGPQFTCRLRHLDADPRFEVAAALGQRRHERRRGSRADPRHEPQHPQPRHRIARVLGEAQEAHEVLDVRHLDESQAPVLAEGDVAPRQFHLERHRVVLRAEQHALVLEQRALLAVVQDALAQPRGLLGLVSAGDQRRTAPTLASGPEVLVAALGRLADDRVGRREDR